jgi:hypothetical protein
MTKRLISLMLLYACVVNPLLILPAKAQTPVTTEKPNPLTYPDGWSFQDAPAPVERQDNFMPYFIVTIHTDPLVKTLPADAHPMLTELNHFQSLGVMADPSRVSWQHNLMINDQPHTTNLVADLINAPLPQAPTYHYKDFGPLSFFEGMSAKSFKAFGKSVLSLPGRLLLLTLCTPFFILNTPNAIADANRDRQNRKVANKAIANNAKSGLQALQVFNTALAERQQTFNPNFNQPEHAFSPTLKPFYNILPTRQEFHLDLVNKQLTYNANQQTVSLRFGFKAPYPSAMEIGQRATNAGHHGNAITPISYALMSESGQEAPLSHENEKMLLSACTLNYANHFETATLACNILNAPANPKEIK